LSLRYVIGRLGFFVAIVWATATINFVVPRLAPGDPVNATLARMAAEGQSTAGSAAIIKAYRHTLGLDQPLFIQYLRYLKSVATFDFGYSAALFPVRVDTLISTALPWTIGLLTVTTLLAFAIGSILGALMVWPQTPRFARTLMSPLMLLSAIPYYLLALALSFFLAFKFGVFPATDATSAGTKVTWSLPVAEDILKHAVLPALSIMLSSIGFWMLGMRGMMVTTIGSDHMLLAEAKGLSSRTLFFRHGLRPAILPQLTALTIALGHVVSGAVLVEVIFGYPGIGGLFYQAIRSNDYPLIQGISLVIAISLALGILLIDLVYPLLDPRISYERR
jgi:peptide/nickel transport system permease protein